jgi:hypothetical protein
VESADHLVNVHHNLGDSRSIRPTENPRIGQRKRLECNSGDEYSRPCRLRSHNEIGSTMRKDIDNGNSVTVHMHWHGFGDIRSIPSSHSAYAHWILYTAHALDCDIDMHDAFDIAGVERHNARDQALPFRLYRNGTVDSMLAPGVQSAVRTAKTHPCSAKSM